MNVHLKDVHDAKLTARVGLAIADGDIHPRPKTPKSLYPYLSQRFQEHMATFGMIPRAESNGRPSVGAPR